MQVQVYPGIFLAYPLLLLNPKRHFKGRCSCISVRDAKAVCLTGIVWEKSDDKENPYHGIWRNSTAHPPAALGIAHRHRFCGGKSAGADRRWKNYLQKRSCTGRCKSCRRSKKEGKAILITCALLNSREEKQCGRFSPTSSKLPTWLTRGSCRKTTYLENRSN